MSKLSELTDLSMYEGHTPCILCKGESSPTLVGGHWKCSVCAHVFNQDGSDIGVQCYCDTCREKQHQEETASDKKGLEAVLDNLKTAVKNITKKKKKKTKIQITCDECKSTNTETSPDSIGVAHCKDCDHVIMLY